MAAGGIRRRGLLRAAAVLGSPIAPAAACLAGCATGAHAGELSLHQLEGPSAGSGRFGSEFWSAPRSVWLRRPATGEQIRLTYWADGALLQQEYERVCWFLRDPYMQRRIDAALSSRQTLPPGWYGHMGMSPVLLDVLYAVGSWLEWFGMSRPLVVTSAFRHPVTNAMTEGAAMDSRHRYGGAADIIVPDVPSSRVGQFGVWLRGGGVGFYPGRNFTHLDDGRLRVWRG